MKLKHFALLTSLAITCIAKAQTHEMTAFECSAGIAASKKHYRETIHSVLHGGGSLEARAHALNQQAAMAYAAVSHLSKSDRALILAAKNSAKQNSVPNSLYIVSIEQALSPILADLNNQRRDCTLDQGATSTSKSATQLCSLSVFALPDLSRPGNIRTFLAGAPVLSKSSSYKVVLSGNESADLKQVWHVYRAELGRLILEKLGVQFDVPADTNEQALNSLLAPLSTEGGFVRYFSKLPESCFISKVAPSNKPKKIGIDTNASTESQNPSGSEKPLAPAGVQPNEKSIDNPEEAVRLLVLENADLEFAIDSITLLSNRTLRIKYLNSIYSRTVKIEAEQWYKLLGQIELINKFKPKPIVEFLFDSKCKTNMKARVLYSARSVVTDGTVQKPAEPATPQSWNQYYLNAKYISAATVMDLVSNKNPCITNSDAFSKSLKSATDATSEMLVEYAKLLTARTLTTSP